MLPIWRKICYPLYFPPSDSPLASLLPSPNTPPTPPPPQTQSLQVRPQPGLGWQGSCCSKRWGCHSHRSLLPLPLTRVRAAAAAAAAAAVAAAAALPVAESSPCSGIPASLEHPAAAGHLQPSQEFLAFSSSSWLLLFQGYRSPSHHRNSVSMTSTAALYLLPFWNSSVLYWIVGGTSSKSQWGLVWSLLLFEVFKWTLSILVFSGIKTWNRNNSKCWWLPGCRFPTL